MSEETIKLLSVKHHDEEGHLDDGIPLGIYPIASPIPADATNSLTDSTRLMEDGEKNKSKSPMSLVQKLSFIGIAISYLTIFMSYSVIAPFFPYEAEKKGVTATETGFVFGIFSFVSFIASPVCGKYLPVVGGKFMFLSGSFLTAGCNILFGFLDQIEGRTTFLAYCFVIRSVEALGSASTLTAGFSICANVFPNDVARMSSFLEIFIGLGLASGPPLGSIFYAIGGYKLPFIVLGGASIALTAVNIFIIPSLSSSKKEDQEAGSLTAVLKIPAEWLTLFSCMWGSAAMSVLSSTLTVHLTSHPLDVKPYMTGVYFLLSGGIYGICSPICGYIADTKKTTRSMIAGSMFLWGISFMLLGPSPMLHLPSQLWIIILALVLAGVSSALYLIVTFLDVLISVRWYGLPNNLGTQSVVSGLFMTADSLGSFVGPIGGSALVNQFGFDWSVTYFAGGYFGIFVLICLFGVWEFQCGKGRRKPSRT